MWEFTLVQQRTLEQESIAGIIHREAFLLHLGTGGTQIVVENKRWQYQALEGSSTLSDVDRFTRFALARYLIAVWGLYLGLSGVLDWITPFHPYIVRLVEWRITVNEESLSWSQDPHDMCLTP